MNKKCKLIRSKVMVGLAATLMLSSTTNVFANQNQVPQISPWAYGVLNEGEKYGIYPMEWYYGDFKGPITSEQLEILRTGVAQKLGELDLELKPNFVPLKVEETLTRYQVITVLFNELLKYEVPTGATQSWDEEVLDYCTSNGIMVGNGKSLDEDQPCTVEQAAIMATRLVEHTFANLNAGSKGMVWKATKGNNTMYLLGSIHIGDPQMYPLHPKVKDAFASADTLIVEANLLGGQEGLDYFIQSAMYQDGTTLSDHVSAATFEKAVKVFNEYKLPQDQYVKFKPWSIANDLSVITSSDSQSAEGGQTAASLGVDLYFMTSALVSQKPIVELEGIKYQADLFNGLSPEEQENYLSGTLDAILNPEEKKESEALEGVALWQEQWKKGDIEGFEKSYGAIASGEESEFSKMLFGKRDKGMAEKLGALLDEQGQKTYFVVVGAGHLAQKDMVIDQLKAKGYTVEIYR